MGDNSYSLLKMKMKEIESSKKSEVKKETRSEQNSSTRKPTLPSKSSANVISSNKPKQSTESQKKNVVDPDVPDHSYGDFYCSICDSHMNSQGMWNSHVTGKKHLKNVKKSVPDTKYEDLNVESRLKYEIRNVKDAIVGLSYIHEIRRKEPGIPPFFTCFLCHANCASAAMVIEHVISLKHRMNYIRENSPNDHELLEATDLKKGQMEPLVAEMAHKLEEKFGSGSVRVKQEKSKSSTWPSKQPNTYFDDDDDDVDDSDDDEKMDKMKKPHKGNPFVWKAVDYNKKDNWKNVKDCRDIIQERKKRAYISDEEENTYVQKNPAKRTVYHSKKEISLSPYFQESSKMEKAYSRRTSNRSPSEDRYKYSRTNPSTYSCSPPQELRKKNVQSSRNSTHTPLYEHSHSRPQIEKESSSNNHPSPNQTKSTESDSNDPLKEFLRKIFALPPEAFLRMVYLRLDTLDVKGMEEMILLSQVINKAQTLLCEKLPADIEAVVKRKMFRNAVSTVPITPTPPATIQVAQPSTENTSFSSGSNFIRNLINLATGKEPVPSVTHIEASHYNTMSYSASTQGNNNPSYQTSYVPPSNESQSYNSVPYNTTSSIPPSNESQSYNSPPYNTTSSIPGLTLTEDNRQAYAYQPQYSNPSSANYPQYKY